jgi:V-type H+-transporting ATPase subunit a
VVVTSAYPFCDVDAQLNPDVNAIQRNFVAEVKRCDEMERKLRFFEDQIEKQNFAEEELEHLQLGLGISSSKKTLVPEMDELEVLLPSLPARSPSGHFRAPIFACG